MQFNWLNIFGAMIVALLLAPNIVYAIKTKSAAPSDAHKALVVLEQIGRYGCIAFMWLPLGVWEFGFSRKGFLLIYLFGCAALLAAYYIVWVLYAKRKTFGKALALSVLPTVLFLLCGVLLRHVLLIVCAVLFGAGHIGVCCGNRKSFSQGDRHA